MDGLVENRAHSMSGSMAIRQWSLSLLLASIWLLFAWLALRPAYFPPSVDGVIELKITKNRVPITTLRERRSVEQKQTVQVDVLDLAHGGRFAHARLGELGYVEHFFVDIDTRVDVLRPGTYRFVVSSDDGFAMYVDENELCSHVATREFTAQTCNVELGAGERRFRIRYFQAGGAAGLRVQYASGEASRLHWFGETTADLRFTPR